MAAKSELLSLSEICKRLNEKSVVIPLLQRNYKWDVEGNSGSDNTLEINSIKKIKKEKNFCIVAVVSR